VWRVLGRRGRRRPSSFETIPRASSGNDDDDDDDEGRRRRGRTVSAWREGGVVVVMQERVLSLSLVGNS